MPESVWREASQCRAPSISGVNTRRSLWIALRNPLSDRQSKFAEPSQDRISLCWYSHRANCRIIDMPESASHVGASQCIQPRKLHTQRTQPIRCCSTSCAAMYAQDGLCQIWLVCSLHSRRCPCRLCRSCPYNMPRECV